VAVRLSPIWTATQFFNSAGQVLAGGKIWQYQSGTTTPQATYTDSTGLTPNANPIILDASGRYTTGEIWFTAGQTYKMVLLDASNNIIDTKDSLTGINDTTTTPAIEWLLQSTPTYISGTSFSVAGNQTAVFQVGRRVQAQINSGFIYATIVTSAFTSLTTVTITPDTGVLDATLSAVSVALLGEVNPSIPASIPYPVAFNGVTNASNTSAGQIGEVISANASSVSLSTGVAKDIVTISLTAGDWEVDAPQAYIQFANTTTWNLAELWINTTSATAPAVTTGFPFSQLNLSSVQTASNASGFALNYVASLATCRVNVNTTTTVYLSGQAAFGVSTASASGFLRARRIR
jgi:hypothetical protein